MNNRTSLSKTLTTTYFDRSNNKSTLIFINIDSRNYVEATVETNIYSLYYLSQSAPTKINGVPGLATLQTPASGIVSMYYSFTTAFILIILDMYNENNQWIG